MRAPGNIAGSYLWAVRCLRHTRLFVNGILIKFISIEHQLWLGVNGPQWTLITELIFFAACWCWSLGSAANIQYSFSNRTQPQLYNHMICRQCLERAHEHVLHATFCISFAANEMKVSVKRYPINWKIISYNFCAKLNEYSFHNNIYQRRWYTTTMALCAIGMRSCVVSCEFHLSICPRRFFSTKFQFFDSIFFPRTKIEQQVIIGLIYSMDHLFGRFVPFAPLSLERINSPHADECRCLYIELFPIPKWMP